MSFLADRKRRLRQLVQALWRTPLMRFCCYSAVGVWVLLGDPFGLSSASDKTIAETLSVIRANLAPVSLPPITVVAIDYGSIRGLHNDGEGWMWANDWPLTYADHERILKDLALPRGEEAPPAALFYDIFFERSRLTSGDMHKLGRTLHRLALSPDAATVYLAGGGTYMPMAAPAYAALGEPALATSAWEGVGDSYPLAAALGQGTGSRFGPARSKTPATALYENLCRADDVNCSWLDAGAPMSVQWPLKMGDGCGQEHWGGRVHSVLGRILRSLGQGFFGMRPPDPAPSHCLPFHQVRLSQLYQPGGASLRPPHLAPDAEYAVLAGVVMPSLKDYVPAPLYGQAEGVYLHAAALENLWRLGEHYVHEQDLTAWTLGVWAVVVAFFMLQAKSRLFLFPNHRFLTTVLSWSAITAIVVLVYLVLYEHFSIAPEGWLPLVTLIPAAREVVLRSEYSLYNNKEHP